MPRRSVLAREYLALAINASANERCIAMQPVLLEVQIAVDQQRTDIRIIADAVSANPGIDERQRHNEQNCQPKNPPPPLRPPLPRHLGWRQAKTRDGFAPSLEGALH